MRRQGDWVGIVIGWALIPFIVLRRRPPSVRRPAYTVVALFCAVLFVYPPARKWVLALIALLLVALVLSWLCTLWDLGPDNAKGASRLATSGGGSNAVAVGAIVLLAVIAVILFAMLLLM